MPAVPAQAAARPIALIGPMAVGKSAIGHQIAQQLGA
ncbi:MAG: shikimate kinase, partial [Arthrobacter sp.]|nr:shikimate kinase [Arthrobacter sp.]